MTILSNKLRRYWYAPGVAAALFVFAIVAPAQVQSQSGRGIESDREAATIEETCVSGDAVQVAQSAPSQTETQPKPILPISAVTVEGSTLPAESMKNKALISADATAQGVEEPKVEKPTERSFRPWQPLVEPRFVQPQPDVDKDAQNGTSEKFHWRKAILQSLLIQSLQHTYAIAAQEKTRRELKGPFFKDWFGSVKNVHGWDDGNRFFTNYIAHPMQGAMTGFIFLQNHDRLKKQKFAESKTYWVDRLKAMAWSTAWSTQWEIGPMSQASIGNVGKKGTGMGYVDLVMTPTAGTGWMVVEEALDRYVIRHLEERSSFFIKMVLRTLLNPMRSVANALRFKEPWYRDRPFGH